MTFRDGMLALCAAAMFSPTVFAQQSTIAKVAFRNAGPYAQADLESAAGVRPGQKMSLADMQAAAQRLVDTGCFDTVALDSHGSPSALALTFVLKPSGTGVIHQIAFGNLVWFTQEELMAIARKADPLVGSGLPEGGAVLDTISDALQAALLAKGVPEAQVSHRLILPSSERPASVIEYRVNKPFVVLNSVTLDGVSPEFVPAVQKQVTSLRGKSWEDGPTEATQHALLRPYLNAGDLDATLTDVQTTFVPQAGGLYGVNLRARVSAGSPYTVGAISFEDSTIVPAASFTAAAKLHVGDVASRAQLIASLAPVDAAYHKLGYMDEYVETGAHLDSSTHKVSYDLRVVPGDKYTVHSVDVQGLSPAARAEFDQAWSLKPGQPYDAAYVSAFVTNNTALRALSAFTGGYSAAADPATHQVDLTVKFIPMPAK